MKLKLQMMPEIEVDVMQGRARCLYDKVSGPKGLTPRQLAFLAHRKDGRKLREIAAFMEIKEAQVYKYRHQIYNWLEVKTDKEAICLSSDWIEQHRAVLPLFGLQGSTCQPGRHKRLKTMEYQVLCLTAKEKLTPEQIAVKCQVHLDVIQKKLKMALTKARREDPSEALAEVKRLGLAPGKKTWQWGTHRRLSG